MPQLTPNPASPDLELPRWQQVVAGLWAVAGVVVFVRLLAAAYLEAVSH